MVVAVLCIFAPVVSAESAEKVASAGSDAAKATVSQALAIAMGFGLAIAAAGGAIGQSRAICSAVEAIARQPEAAGNIRGSLIIGLALIETLVIYVLLICFFLNGKFPTL
ncbi:MAG: ATP synthase F0 subunit C [Candidatus Brocadiae bacterium]|nr:ATP synthase F0 subunit C [Candidatus Brocadiia bacterium]